MMKQLHLGCDANQQANLHLYQKQAYSHLITIHFLSASPNQLSHFQLYQSPLHPSLPPLSSFSWVTPPPSAISILVRRQSSLYLYSNNIFYYSYSFMRFKQDSVYDFVSYKLSNPQALQQQMKMIKQRQDCAKKLEDYSKQMQQLKNQHHMYKQLLEATMAKKNYLQQNYEDSKSELNQKINICKEMLEFNNRQCKERQIRNENNRKDYSEFQKQIVLQRDKLTIYHMNELNYLSNHCEQLKNNIEEKQQKRMKLQQQLRRLKDRQRLIENTKQNTQTIRNKWFIKKKELQKTKEQYLRKDKEIKDLIIRAMSMQKVIYSNFYKRCIQIVSKMKEGLLFLFSINIEKIEGGNLEERMEKALQQLKNGKQQLQKFIIQKRQEYKIGPSLPEPDAQVYNNIVQTKIIPSFLRQIDQSQYRNNIVLLEQMQNGLLNMFIKQQQQRQNCQIKMNQVEQEKQGLLINLSKLDSQIQAKRKQIPSPTKKSKKG